MTNTIIFVPQTQSPPSSYTYALETGAGTYAEVTFYTSDRSLAEVQIASLASSTGWARKEVAGRDGDSPLGNSFLIAIAVSIILPMLLGFAFLLGEIGELWSFDFVSSMTPLLIRWSLFSFLPVWLLSWIICTLLRPRD